MFLFRHALQHTQRSSMSQLFASHPHLSCPDIHRIVLSSRAFSVSCSINGHYQTLSVPHNATKNQIKSSFYKLSKLHHPDVAKDPKATVKFQAVSEAYAVLGDERKRRAYDRTLAEGSSYVPPHPATTKYYTAAYQPRRKPGATYAWEYSHPAGTHHRPPPGYTHSSNGFGHPYQQSHAQEQGHRHPDPFSSPHVQKATGYKAPPHPYHHQYARHQHTAQDHVNRISGFWRAVQVLGVVMVVATIGGGFHANA